MKTIQMTLDEELVEKVDQAVGELGTSRSAFTRHALRKALERIEEERLEQKHREGYVLHPVRREDIDDWEAEQVWGD